MNLPGEKGPVPRFLPEEPLPPYAFVPGRSPHPESDPAGHSYGRGRQPAPPVDPERWQASRRYLFGLDLFNGGFPWESHVEWESLWLASGRQGLVADFLKGLIKLAAAGVKYREGMPRGTRSHALRAAELFRAVAAAQAPADLFLGLSLQGLVELAERIGRDGWPEEGPFLLPDGLDRG